MLIHFHSKGIGLNESARDYIEKKIMNLKKYYNVGDDDTSTANIEISQNKERSSNLVNISVRIIVSKKTFMSETKGVTVEEAIDLAHDKLKVQLQRYKERMKEENHGK
ncbi:MAG: ribosomal subunit interface protein [Candidatus Abawacabacteria bacterium RBG_16_42_10]|uniref:Ribosomal subunit interface protein n=1 Tax=Candidatus Abawacabacteria bacterium RBG_16_42_10 TaxID=1817814 RepID=A0A1F4XK76_9BACT|nr:MAG: ribosomal subunit interface protein [Candidatus Abawacabacteria bacterium RBG_16_42_10]